MRVFYYSPDSGRSLSINNAITIKELTGSDGWQYMVQSSDDRRTWSVYKTPVTVKKTGTSSSTTVISSDNAVNYDIPNALAGKYIRIVVGGDIIPISNDHTLTGESCSPVYKVLAVTSDIESVISDIEVRSADKQLVSTNDHGIITLPILHLNREPVKEDFQNFENVLAIVNRPTHFTFEPAPLFFNSQNGYSQYSYVSSNTHWVVKSKPAYIQLVREGQSVEEGNGTLAFHVNVVDKNLPHGIYNDYIIFEDTSTGEEIHVPFQIDVDVPLTVNEKSDKVTITFTRDDTTTTDSEQLRVVRDRYWHFTDFTGTYANYFTIGRKDGSHNAVTTLSITPDFPVKDSTTTPTLTFFAISNNYIVRIEVYVTVKATCSIKPVRILFNYDCTASNASMLANFIGQQGTDAIGKYRQHYLEVSRLNYRFLNTICKGSSTTQYASATPNTFSYKFLVDPNDSNSVWLKIEETTLNSHAAQQTQTTDTFRITYYPTNAAKQKQAGQQKEQFKLQYRAGTSSDTAPSNFDVTVYYNVPRVYGVRTVNEHPIPDPSDPNKNNGIWEQYCDWSSPTTPIITSPTVRKPYLYTRIGSPADIKTITKSTAVVYYQCNVSDTFTIECYEKKLKQVFTYTYLVDEITTTITTVTGSSVTADYGDFLQTHPQCFSGSFSISLDSSFEKLRHTDFFIKLKINAVAIYKHYTTASTDAPSGDSSTFPAVTITIPVEARRQHFLRANDLGTLLPDFNYRRLGAPFVHNTNCVAIPYSESNLINLILHEFTTSANGYVFTTFANGYGYGYGYGDVGNLPLLSGTATHIGAKFNATSSAVNGYQEFGRSQELSLTSRVLTKDEATALNSKHGVTTFVGYDAAEFLGAREIKASLSAYAYNGYDDDNMIPVVSAVQTFSGISNQTVTFEKPSSSSSSSTSCIESWYIRGDVEADSTQIAGVYAANFLSFGTSNNETSAKTGFANRHGVYGYGYGYGYGAVPHQLYTFARPRVIRGICFNQPPSSSTYSQCTSTDNVKGAVYYVETRLKYNDGSYGNWQPLLMTTIPIRTGDNANASRDSLQTVFRTCVPRLATEVRLFRKYNYNFVFRPSSSNEWEIVLPYLHFYENTPLFYKATTSAARLAIDEADSDYRSLPFFNSRIGYYLVSNETAERNHWYDIANSNTANNNPEKTITGYDSLNQNMYMFNLACAVDDPMSSRSLAEIDVTKNYVKLIPARRTSTAATSIKSNGSSISLKGAILYAPYDTTDAIAGSLSLQTSSSSVNDVIDFTNHGNLRQLAGTWSSVLSFSLGNHFGAIRLNTPLSTATLGNDIEYKLENALNQFAREMVRLLLLNDDKDVVTVLNDNPTDGCLIRGVLNPNPNPNSILDTWTWTSYGSSLYLKNWLDVATAYARTSKSDADLNTILKAWIEEIKAQGESVVRLCMPSIAIYDAHFKRYKFNNANNTTNDVANSNAWNLSPFTQTNASSIFNPNFDLSVFGTWTADSNDFKFDVKLFYHQTVACDVKYLALVCNGLLNTFDKRTNAIKYGDLQLFHRYTGAEMFFDEMKEITGFRESKTYYKADRYYADTQTYDTAGWIFAEDWVDCYCGYDTSYTLTKPRQSNAPGSTFELMNSHENETTKPSATTNSTTSTTFTFNTASVKITATAFQSTTLCTELATDYGFAMPNFTYIAIRYL